MLTFGEKSTDANRQKSGDSPKLTNASSNLLNPCVSHIFYVPFNTYGKASKIIDHKTIMLWQDCPFIFPQTPAGVTLTCDLQYRHRSCNHPPNLTETVWGCKRRAQSISHSVIALPSPWVSSPEVHPCPAEQCETQSACHTLSGTHSAEPTAPGGGNVFYLLLKNTPLSVCVLNCLSSQLRRSKITIINHFWWLWDRESVHLGEMEEARHV